MNATARDMKWNEMKMRFFRVGCVCVCACRYIFRYFRAPDDQMPMQWQNRKKWWLAKTFNFIRMTAKNAMKIRLFYCTKHNTKVKNGIRLHHRIQIMYMRRRVRVNRIDDMRQCARWNNRAYACECVSCHGSVWSHLRVCDRQLFLITIFSTRIYRMWSGRRHPNKTGKLTQRKWFHLSEWMRRREREGARKQRRKTKPPRKKYEIK